MTEFATVKDLRDSLATLLDADLGTYENGIKRIWVYPPQPPAANGEGLECMIQRQPVGDIRSSSGGQRKDFREWIVTLINYSDDASLSSAAEKIKANYLFPRGSPPQYSPPTPETFEQVIFRILDPILINY